MTTPLTKQVKRRVVVGEDTYNVVMEPEGVRISLKGRRHGALVAWETILALSEVDDAPRAMIARNESDVPNAIAGEVAAEVRSARAALVRVVEKLAAIPGVPSALLSEMDPDPVYGQMEHRADWYIEPLLTPAEVASVLRVSKAAVSRLPIRWVSIAGEPRHRQSAIREYLKNEERADGYRRW